jgi:hypothetical protein
MEWGKKHYFSMFLNTNYYRHQNHISLLLFHVIWSVCVTGWMGCVSAVKLHTITNCVTAKTRFWVGLKYPYQRCLKLCWKLALNKGSLKERHGGLREKQWPGVGALEKNNGLVWGP